MATAFEPRLPAPTSAPVLTIEARMRQHRNALQACARRLLGDDPEAAAVVDEVLATAAHAIVLFRPAGSLGSWLQGVTVGASLARLRARGEAACPLRERRPDREVGTPFVRSRGRRGA